MEEITDGLNGLGLDVQPIPDDLAADIAMEKQLEAVLSSERPTPTAPTRRNRPIGQISLPALASVANDKVSSGELRFLANRLTEALRDALRVAESRGGRLLTPNEHGTDEPDDGH
ncbi:hypothetical protein [Streptomyces sp. NPDC005336]|uniref:hypothetical protein n=1 Tax=unclassified Streptomyces TaxID=2593676 RepID=UPI0033B67E30